MIKIKLVTKPNGLRMLTVSKDTKWYDIYILNCDGTCEPVIFKNIRNKVADVIADCWYDHCISPIGFLLVAGLLNCKVDQDSYKAVITMFIENYYFNTRTVIDVDKMPSDELVRKILVKQ